MNTTPQDGMEPKKKPPAHWRPPVNNADLQTIFHRASMFQNGALAKTVMNDYEALEKLADLTGDDVQNLIIFSPERLLLQETVIAVDSRVRIRDDRRSVDAYGVNFRDAFNLIYEEYVGPKRAEIESKLGDLLSDIEQRVDSDLDYLFSLKDATKKEQFLYGLLFTGDNGGYETTDFQRAERARSQALYNYHKKLQGVEGISPDDFRAVLKRLVVAKAYNQTARDAVLRPLKGCIKDAIKDEQVAALPRYATQEAFVYAVHGTPAVGKSTMRPRIRSAVETQGSPWHTWTVLNADVWRAILLERETLNEHEDYWGPLTDNELSLMWNRMRDLLKRPYPEQPNILVDHFYPNIDEMLAFSKRSNHYHMSFLIADPDQVVARSYERGKKRGRYIPLESLLLNLRVVHADFKQFLHTATSEKVKIEFIDNSTSKGEEPHTFAYADMEKEEINVYDVAGLLLIDRMRSVNVGATSRDEVFSKEALDPENNLGVLETLADNLTINFVDDEGYIYAQYSRKNGLWICDEDEYARRLQDPYYQAALGMLEARAENTPAGVKRLCPADKLVPVSEGMVGQAEQHTRLRDYSEIELAA